MPRKPSKPSKPAAKKPAPKAKPARASKTSSAKPKAKKPEKPLPPKKASAPAPASKARAAKPAKAPAPRGAPAKPAAKAGSKAKQPKVAGAASAKKKPALVPLGVAKPGLGHKWSCFNCGAKFYDLGKPVPVCPKCEADQRDRPLVVPDAAPPPPQPKRPAMAPMSRFLDDDEVAAPEPDEFGVATPDAEIEEPEAAEIDIESLDEPAALGAEGDFSEPDEE